MSDDKWDQIEDATMALNEWLYADEAGLEAPREMGATLSRRLADLYGQALAVSARAERSFLVDGWVEARRVPRDTALTAAMDTVLTAPELVFAEGTLTWRNWKAYERQAKDAPALRAAFAALLSRSSELTPVLETGLAQQRDDYGRWDLTPAQTFAEREGLTVEALRALLWEVGRGCHDLFQASLDQISRQVFGRAAGPAEVRALYLNRMYEPNKALFALEAAVPQTLAAFRRLGFDLSRVPVDVESRPRKYPGAFCFPVRTPSDVRVSVQMASAHHLVDMLYHELGHAVHFAGIGAQCSFVERYWITAGIHETFSTLFESLLSEPLFLEEQFGFGAHAIEALLGFGRFKDTLTATWLGAAGLTALEAWQDGLTWAEVEQRYAENMLAFTGVAFPPGFARLEPFTASASIYPAGYVLAWARVSNWRRHLRALGGEAWWHSPAAQADIRARVAAGGAGMFPDEWRQPEVFLAYLRERPIMGGAP